MRTRRILLTAGVGTLAIGAVATAIAAGGPNHSADLAGFSEVPVVSTTGHGDFTARRSADGDSVDWELSYSDIEGTVTQAHIHFGQNGVNGGISVWLCSNLASPPTPAGVQPCPAQSGTVTGTFDADDVVGPTGQGIAPGELAELLDAIAAGVTYANVHSSKVGSGEIRGQIRNGTSSD